MVFELSGEQRDFRDTIRRLLEKECESARLRRCIEGSKEERSSLVQALNTMQLHAAYGDPAAAREALAELIILASECGRALCPEHFVDSIVSGPLLSALFLSPECKKEINAIFGVDADKRIAAGNFRVQGAPFFYHDEAALQIKRNDTGVTIATGELRLVPFSDGAEAILYRHTDATLLIPLKGISNALRTPEHTVDITLKRERLKLDNLPVAFLELREVPAFTSLQLLLMSAEIAGACRRVLDMTSDYMKTRQQFGVPLGTFQAVQHALADMFLKVEMIESLQAFASWSFVSSPDQRELSAQSAVRLALREGVAVVEKAIQLHGGIGFTWEHDLHLYLRRVRSITALAGDLRFLDSQLLSSVRSSHERLVA